MKTVLLVMLAATPMFSNAQDQPAEQLIVLKLQLLTPEKKPIETEVSFENLQTHNHLKFKTSSEGKADCRLPAGYNYNITITESNDSYEYTIPDFFEEPIDAELTFNTKIDIRGATKTMAVAIIQPFNNFTPHDIKIHSQGKSEITSKLNNDTNFIRLPINNTYIVEIKGVTIKNNKIIIDNTEFNLLYHVLYFSDNTHAELIPVKNDMSAVHVKYIDLNNNTVPNETITIKGISSNKTYTITTNSNGSGITMLPKNDKYDFSLKHFPSFSDLNISGADYLTTNNVTIRYPSSKEIELAQREAEAALRIRDSLYKLYEKTKEESLSTVLNTYKAETPKIEDEIKKDSLYFVKTENVVAAVLYRNKAKWKNRLIVTDVTGSMYPYMKQVVTWHLLESMLKEKSTYLFFNDGDNMPDRMKELGKTGGIYYNENDVPDSMVKTMNLAMRNGDGGDGPENDIEAILKAQEIAKSTKDIILIADNYSCIKDIALLNYINVPVRVVLCGAPYPGNINPDYLQLAYKTEGSIHTIEKDIWDLSNLNEGEVITIEGQKYQLARGKFFPINRRL